jgi:flavocytochrome c
MPHAIVVGGGLSGLSACHTLIEGGSKVTLIEKNAFLGGNSTKATSGLNGSGTRTQKKLGIGDSYEAFLEDTVRSATGKKTGPMPEPYPLAKVVAGESADAVHWIQDSFGLALDTVSRLGGHSYERTHRSLNGGKFPGMEITSALMKKYEELAGMDNGTCDLIINADMKSLIYEGGRVVGVRYVDGDGVAQECRADAVVLATGGYGAGVRTPGSFLEKVRPDLTHLPTTNGDHSQGDGITVALDIGAKAIGLKHVQVHPTGLINESDPDCKTKFLAAEALRGEGGILLDNQGSRFVNDIGKRDYVSGSMWSHNKAPYRLVLSSGAAKNLQWHCKHYVSRRVMKHFASGHDLAKEMGIPAEQLKASFDTYNEAARTGKDAYGKIYFKNADFQMNDNFYVALVTPVVHYCMGGLAISDKAECVYESDNTVVHGLYAAGELAGGIHGRNRLGGSALCECIVFGRVAGRHALEYINAPKPAAVAAGPSTTTTITIPQTNGADPITITYTSGGGASAATAPRGRKIDVLEWNDAVTTEVGALTAGADGAEVDDTFAPVEKKIAQPAAAVANPSAGQDIAVVVGSFFMGDSERDAATIVDAFPGINGLAAPKAVAGNDFDFNSLANTKYLIVVTSSMYGNPPKNFWQFYYHLKAASLNGAKPLKGLKYAVYGNGDETYFDTYMNVPRMVDNLLEKAGATRFYARGETGEPHKPTGSSGVQAPTWAAGMWGAITSPSDAPVAWDSCWEGSKPNHHTDVTDWDMAHLQKKYGKPETVSVFDGAKL